MNTLTRGFAKRALSMLLVVMMLMSLCVVGITSASAANVNLAEVGASRTFAAGDYIYIKNFTPSGWSANWFASDVYEWAHIWNSSANASIDIQFKLVEGTENAVGAVYGAEITTAGTYDYVIFSRSHSSTTPWDQQNQTGNIPLDATNNCYTNLVVDGTSYTGSVYGGGTTTSASFWIDLNPDDDTSDIDLLYPDKKNGNYYFYLPSGTDTTKLEFHVSEGATLTLSGSSTPDGKVWNLSDGVNGGAYPLGGSFSGNMYLKQSANVSSVHTTTEEKIPQGTNLGLTDKDKYETNGMIEVVGADGTVKLEEAVLKKIEGRGNSSWEASDKIIGKYAFNITLDAKAKLLDESAKSKKYCLVSYNADEARMRNMVIYELAQQIGVEYVADYEPVDLYNNGYYVGSYLLTDKVEIGDPLVDIVNLDDENEAVNPTIYEDETFTRAYGGGSSINDASTKGFYKYISNLTEPDPSVYADSGFLLEFELNERFANEISGFISTKGQQIVCKYPEYATKNEITFIMNKWNTAEAIMYDDTATYEELDAVIDVESFAKMYLIQELTKNLDGGATSYYVYYHEGKLHAGVAWDYDWTLGQYEKTYTDRVNSGSDFYDQVDANPSTSGGWYLNSKNIYGASVLNAQAALCQNDAFWSVVTAEWNENFYSEATKFTNGTASTSVSAMDGIIADFYNQVKASTVMDENKWGLIASDPLYTNNWGSTDTGDTHDAAVVWLDQWMHNRLTWMNKYIGENGGSHTGIYDVDYVIQPPSVSADKDSYEVGETVTLTIEDKTDGSYVYTVYKDGSPVGISNTGTYTFVADRKGTANYTVIANSSTTKKVSAASEAAAVNVEGFNLDVDVSAPVSVQVGENITIEATDNTDETVTYILKDATTGTTIETNNTGYFSIPATEEGTKSYTLEASATVDGEDFTIVTDITVNVTAFSFNLTFNPPQSVEAGMTLVLNASAPSTSEVTYEFYDGDGKLLTSNTTGKYTVATTQDDVDTTRTYYVKATTTVAGKEYTATSDTKTVSITAVSAVYDVTIYFKSTSTLGYKPLISTTGAVNNLTDYSMIKDELIGKNATQTASYYWYKAEVDVSKANPTLSVSVLSSRYAMEGDIDLTITQSGDIYLAVDDLNQGYEMINLTDWPEDKRNWCESAVHMVFDDTYDTEEELAEVAAGYVLASVGDSNYDGKVNIKDATLIQKSLVGLAQLDSVGAEVADVNDDGTITIKDATAIQKKLVARL